MTGPLTAGVEARRLSAPEARRPRLSGGNVELDVSALISRAEVPTLVAQLLHERADTAEPPLEPLAAERCALDAYDEAARQNDGIVLLDEFSATVANVLLSLASRMLRSPALDAPGTDGPRADGSVDDANIASGADGPADGATHADEIDLLVLADLVSILANRSAAPVTNTDLQFAFDERGIPTAAPDDLSARTTGGLALDLGKQGEDEGRRQADQQRHQRTDDDHRRAMSSHELADLIGQRGGTRHHGAVVQVPSEVSAQLGARSVEQG